MLIGGRYKIETTRAVTPDGYYVASQACSGRTCLKGIDDLLLLKGRPVAKRGVNEQDYEVYALSLDMSNLEMFHDSNYKADNGSPMVFNVMGKRISRRPCPLWVSIVWLCQIVHTMRRPLIGL